MENAQVISSGAMRIREKLRKRPPPTLLGDEEGLWTPVRTVSSSVDGTPLFSSEIHAGNQEEQLPGVQDAFNVVPIAHAVDQGDRVIRVADVDDIVSDKLGLLFTFDNSRAEQMYERARRIATYLYKKESTQHVLSYVLNVSTNPLVAKELALNYRGPAIIALLDGFPQSLDCEADGYAVEQALLEKVKSGFVDVCTEEQAKLFRKTFSSSSSVIGVYRSLADVSYRYVVEVARKRAHSGLQFAVTEDSAAARALLPDCSFGRKSYIGMVHAGSCYPFTGSESLKGLICFISKTVKYKFKLLQESAGNPD